MRTASLPLLLLLPLLPCTAALLPGQLPAPPAGIGKIADSGVSRVLVDEPGDGNLWVLAPGYKARFGRDGVDFIPFYGASAPRNFPVSFRLRGVERGGRALALASDVAPRADGLRVVYERGGVREVWELREREAEQTFVVAAGTGRGDLTVRVDVTSEVGCEDVADGLSFAHAGLGTVHYGDLVAFGAEDTAYRGASRWTGTGIELRVPASFADDASGPITIDPIVRAIPISTGSDTDFDPDVAYEPNGDRWLVVFERAFSTRDHDIIARRYSGEGTFIDEVAVATGSRESYHPAVAANAGARQFLIAWDEDTGIADRVIKGRTRTANSAVQGTTFVIMDSSGVTVEDRNPTVGGTTSTDVNGDFYMVASEFWAGNTSGRIRLAVVSSAGVVTRTSAAGAVTAQATDPVITKARPTGGRWLLAYRTSGDLLVEALDPNFSGGGQIVDNQSFVIGAPAVAGDGFQFFVAYDNFIAAGDRDIRIAHLRIVRGVLSVLSNIDATVAEGSAVITNDQTTPAITFDGCRVTYTYLESVGVAGNYDTFATVMQFEPVVAFSDSHRRVHPATSNTESSTVIASEGEMGGDRGRMFIAWDFVNSNVEGCLFDGTANLGGVTTLATACGNIFAPVITVQNPPALGATLRVRATPIQPQSQIYLVGIPSSPITLCAAGCKLGMTTILLTRPGTDLNLPIACDMNLIGALIAIQNVLVGGPAGCTTANFPVAFTISDTVIVQVQ